MAKRQALCKMLRSGPLPMTFKTVATDAERTLGGVMEPITLGVLAAAAVTGTVGNMADRALHGVLQRVQKQLAEGDLPRNHDVALAARRAQMLALNLSLRGYVRLLDADRRSGGAKRDIERPLSKLIREALKDRKFKSLDRKRQKAVLDEIDRVFRYPAPSDGAAGGRQAALRTLAEDWTLAEAKARVRNAKDWPRFETFVRNGEDAARTPIPAWWDAFRAFMAEEIKSDPRVAAILAQQGLSEILDRHHDLDAVLTDMRRGQEDLARSISPALAAFRASAENLDRRLNQFDRHADEMLQGLRRIEPKVEEAVARAAAAEHKAGEATEEARGARSGVERLLDITTQLHELPLTRYIPLSDGEIANLPTRLVVADHGIVAYEDITDLAERTLAWARAGDGVMGRLVAGGGGYGKTRLALHVADTLFKEGWRYAGVLSRAELDHAEAMGRLRSRIIDPDSKGVFVVIDYAEARVAQIRTLVRAARAVQGEPKAKPVRILLLARSAGTREAGRWRHSEGDWWHSLLNESEADTAPERHTFEREPSFAETANAVPEEKRAAFVARAAQTFEERLTAAKSDLVAPAGERKPIPPARLAGDAAGSPLLLSFEAFLQVRGAAMEGSAIAEMARDEAKHWLRALGADAPSMQAPLARAMQRAVGLVTLTQGADVRQAETIARLAVERAYAGQGEGDAAADARADARKAVAAALTKLYSDGDRLRPVQPDLLGEHVVGEALAVAPGLLAETLNAYPERAVLTFTVLNRATKPVHDHALVRAPTETALRTALRADLATRADEVVTAAQSEVGRLQVIAYEVLTEMSGEARAEAGLAIARAPARSGLLLRIPVHLIALLGEAASSASVRRTAHPEFAAMRAESAHDAGLQGLLLSGAGRHGEAISAYEQSLREFRALAPEDTGMHAGAIAETLTNYAKALYDSGNRREAVAAIEEAIAICRPHFEQLIGPKGGDLSDRQAQLAVLYATSTLNSISYLSGLGDHIGALERAEEAIALFRALVRGRPRAHTGSLAIALSNYAGELNAVGRRAEALTAIEESVSLFRAAASDDPLVMTPQLAMATRNQAKALADAGRHAEAVVAAKETVEIDRHLAKTDAKAFTPDLATSISNLASMLWFVGQRTEALVTAEEAIELRSALATSDPLAFTPGLAKSISNYAGMLPAVGRHAEGLAMASQAVSLYRDLAKTNPAFFVPELARALTTLANALMCSGSPKDAVPELTEATTILVPFANESPEAMRGLMETIFEMLIAAFQMQGKSREECLAAADAIVLPIIDQAHVRR